jgi:hypothetical protein
VIRRIGVPCLGLVAAAALAPPALGQSPPWAVSPPLPLPVDTGSDGFDDPAAIAADGRGGALLAWAYPGEKRSRGLAVAHVAPTGAIDMLQRLPARPGESLEEPALEADQGGRFTLAYLRRTRRRGVRVMVASATATGLAGRPRSIVLRHTRAWNGPALAVAPDGAAVVAWSTGRTSVLQASFRRAGGAFGRPRTLAASALYPAVAAGGPGEVAVAWVSKGAARLVTWRNRRLGRPITMARRVGVASVPLAMDSDGRAAVAWERGRRLWVAMSTRSGRITRAPLAPGAPDATRPMDIAGGGAGTIVVLSTDGGNTRLWAHVGVHGRFGAAEPVSAPDEFVDARMGVDVNAVGAIAVGWAGENRAQAARRPPGGGFAAPEVVSPPVSPVAGADIVVGADGAVALTWLLGGMRGAAGLRPPG